MSLLDQGQTSHSCPRCKIILSPDQTTCYNCGFQVAIMQSSNIARDTQVPSLGGSRGSSLGISQRGRGQGSSLEISQAREGQTSPVLGIPQARGGQPFPVSAMSQSGGVQTPALGIPQARRDQTSSSAMSPSPSSKIEKDQSFLRQKATLVYFTSVVLVIIVVAFAGLHAAGISLSTLTSHGAVTSAVTYPLPKVAPLFADSFLNDASGWNLQSSPGNYQVTVGNGSLTLNVDKNKLLWEPLPGTISYSDFTLSVNALLAKGDQNNGYGLYIRGAAVKDNDLATYYRFELYGDGSYAIFKGTIDQNGTSVATKVVNYTLNSAIQKQGKSNNIMLVARGASVSFIVNGQLLKTFTDASYTTGSIALFASNLPEAKPGIQVQFSQLALYPMQESGPS